MTERSLGTRESHVLSAPSATAPGAVFVPVLRDGDSARSRLSRWLLRHVLRLSLGGHSVLSAVARRCVKKRASPAQVRVLLTATFHSDNWIKAHLVPLAASNTCTEIVLVCTSPDPAIPHVRVIHPPDQLIRMFGGVAARLMTFCAVALSTRPDWIGGVHLLVNGLTAGLMAALTGARSLYFCVGGPAEVVGGGIGGENRIFSRIGTPDPQIERQLVAAVRQFDLAITMGTGAAQFFRRRGLTNRFEVMPGGFDISRFSPGVRVDKRYDCVLVARLAEVKRIHLFLDSVAAARERRPGIRTAIVGDGELRRDLELHARRLGIEDNVLFAGNQADVVPWLRASRLFVLTSVSEGLALSLVEAMLCGAVPVVADVGDLGDLVEDGVNGFLVRECVPSEFAHRFDLLLNDPARLDECSRHARETAVRLSVENTALSWVRILGTQRMDMAELRASDRSRHQSTVPTSELE